MPRKPLLASLVAVLFALSATSCSSDSDSPDPGSDSSKGTDGTSSTPAAGKLHKETGKGGIKNVYAKTSSGAKITLYAEAPGHEIMQQTHDEDADTWSAPVSVFKDDTRFCHALKLKAKTEILAATVTCSISARDVNGTQSSYVLASTDAKTWKQANLDGASGKPSISPNGKFVSWRSPAAFLLWNPDGAFVTAKYAQSEATPTLGITQDDGSVLLMKAMETKNKTCTISFSSVSAKAPAPKALNSTLPQADRPHCVATTAKMQGPDLIGTFETTSTEKDKDGKKVQKTDTFAIAFHKLASGNWIIKS